MAANAVRWPILALIDGFAIEIFHKCSLDDQILSSLRSPTRPIYMFEALLRSQEFCSEGLITRHVLTRFYLLTIGSIDEALSLNCWINWWGHNSYNLPSGWWVSIGFVLVFGILILSRMNQILILLMMHCCCKPFFFFLL